MINATLYKVLNSKFKGEKMKKTIVSLAVTSLLFVGCGGGGSSTSTYDITDYLTTTDSSVKTWDMYKIDNDGTIVDYSINSLKTTEWHMGDVRTIGTIGTFYIFDDNIKLRLGETAPKYKRRIELKDKLSNCTWDKFYSSITLKNDETFDNVLELSCNKYKYYFAKNKGNIAKIEKNNVNQSLSLLINTINVKEQLTVGEVTENDNDTFKLE